MIVKTAFVCLCLAAATCGARPLTVLTWNTMHYDWDRQTEELKQARTRAMFEALRTSGADIVLVQETYGCYDRFLKGLPGWHGALLGACNSVYSRYPIVKTYEPYDDGLMYGTTNGYAYGTSTKPFTFAVAEIDVEGQRVRACPIAMNWQPYCIRMPKTMSAEEALKWEAAPQPNGGRPRPLAMRKILESIADMRAEADEIPIVIGGDFNSQSHLDWTPATASLKEHAGRVIPWEVSRIMVEAGFVDTFRQMHPDPAKEYGTTYGWLSLGKPESAINLRLDYLYALGRKLKTVSSETCTRLYLKPYTYHGREYSLFPSDHGFLITRFELEGGVGAR